MPAPRAFLTRSLTLPGSDTDRLAALRTNPIKDAGMRGQSDVDSFRDTGVTVFPKIAETITSSHQPEFAKSVLHLLR
jgi:hypothetical protein